MGLIYCCLLFWVSDFVRFELLAMAVKLASFMWLHMPICPVFESVFCICSKSAVFELVCFYRSSLLLVKTSSLWRIYGIDSTFVLEDIVSSHSCSFYDTLKSNMKLHCKRWFGRCNERLFTIWWLFEWLAYFPSSYLNRWITEYIAFNGSLGMVEAYGFNDEPHALAADSFGLNVEIRRAYHGGRFFEFAVTRFSEYYLLRTPSMNDRDSYHERRWDPAAVFGVSSKCAANTNIWAREPGYTDWCSALLLSFSNM